MEQLDVLPKKETTATVELSRKTGGKHWNVESIIFRFPHHFNRMMFRDTASIQSVLHKSLLVAILPYLMDTDEAGILSAKGFHVVIPGASIDGLRVMTHVGQPEKDLVTLQFVKISGAPFNITNSAYQPYDVPSEQCADLASLTLVELVKPCVELVDHIVKNGLTSQTLEHIRPRLKTMTRTGERLTQYANDIKDAICHLRAEDPTAAIAFAEGYARAQKARNTTADVLFGHQDALKSEETFAPKERA